MPPICKNTAATVPKPRVTSSLPAFAEQIGKERERQKEGEKEKDGKGERKREGKMVRENGGKRGKE